MRYVITFQSVHFVMKAEALLKNEGISVRLIPIPRNISSDCGIAIEVLEDEIEKAKDILEENGQTVESVHSITEMR